MQKYSRYADINNDVETTTLDTGYQTRQTILLFGISEN